MIHLLAIVAWALFGFAAIYAVGWLVRQHGAAGFRTKAYAFLSTALTWAATAGGFLLTEADLLARVGLDAGAMAALMLAAKAADFLNHLWLRDLTTGPPKS